MNIPRFFPAILATLMVTSAWAQSASTPLNLKLPPSDLPAAGSSTAVATSPSSNAPGVYYGDTSGRMGNTGVASDARPPCDDSTYNQPQVHGSVGVGVMSGRHVSGNYQTGTVSVSKAFGSCDDPGGVVNFSISSGTGRFHGRGH